MRAAILDPLYAQILILRFCCSVVDFVLDWIKSF